MSRPAEAALASCTDVCSRTARRHTLPGTHRRTCTCGVRTSRSSSLTWHLWPPNSPDLNPVDCAVWGALQQKVYQHRRFTTINQLKQAFVTELSWANYCSVSSIAPLVSGVTGFSGSSRSKANKKLIRRWDSERELSLRRHCTRTKNTIHSCINSATDRFLQHRFTKFSEIIQCNGHYAVQVHSRSPILVPIESSYTTSY